MLVLKDMRINFRLEPTRQTLGFTTLWKKMDHNWSLAYN